MVKVVSDKPIHSIKITCKKCCYVLEYTGVDIKYRTNSDGDVTNYIICPRDECKATLFVKRWN
jgi:RNase P subunit RPR2